jgi:hypothetical protein
MPTTVAAFAISQAWPQHVPWLMNTAVAIELAAHRSAIDPSIHVINPVKFNLDSLR